MCSHHALLGSNGTIQIELSVHSKAAVSAAKVSVGSDLIRVALSTPEGKPSFEAIAKHAGEAMAKEFATSVVADQLAGTFGDGAGNVASGAVIATYALLHGEKGAAAQAAVQQVSVSPSWFTIPIPFPSMPIFGPIMSKTGLRAQLIRYFTACCYFLS